MNEETLLKVEKSIKNLSDKKNRIYFLCQDTKGNAKGRCKNNLSNGIIAKRERI
jgi:hypothetical protein